MLHSPKRERALTAYAALVLAIIASSIWSAPCPAAGFTDANAKGNYDFSLTKFGPCTNLEHAVGLLTFNGKGGITGSVTIYNTGSGTPFLQQFTLTGSYKVNANGTGNLTLVFAGGSFPAAFVIDNLNSLSVAREIDLLSTDTSKSKTCAEQGVALLQK